MKGEPSQVLLEEKINIDLGSREYERFGFKQPAFAEADSEGNIYVVEEYGPVDYFINKFDQNGKYITRFARFGQGPGEIEVIYTIRIDSHDRILISDMGKSKVVEYDKNGTLVHETPIPSEFRGVTPLENGKCVGLRRAANVYELVVLDSNLMMKTLDSYGLSESAQSRRTAAIVPLFYWRVTSERIYVGNEQRGYEILVFDLDGNLLKKIRKEFSPVKYYDDFKAQTKRMIEHDPHYVMLEKMPPFNSFMIDDSNRLYVMTYEKGGGNDEYLHDVYDSDGVLIGRTSMKLHGVLGRGLNHRWAVAKNGCYYCLKYDEESGYPRLIVYQLIWK
jgi:hypothetical protein